MYDSEKQLATLAAFLTLESTHIRTDKTAVPVVGVILANDECRIAGDLPMPGLAFLLATDRLYPLMQEIAQADPEIMGIGYATPAQAVRATPKAVKELPESVFEELVRTDAEKAVTDGLAIEIEAIVAHVENRLGQMICSTEFSFDEAGLPVFGMVSKRDSWPCCHKHRVFAPLRGEEATCQKN